jgi:hypothetical protein
VQGFTQENQKHYDQTSAQAARPETWRLLMFEIKQGWIIEQWDVEGAYLNPDVHHTIYVKDKTTDGKEEVWKPTKPYMVLNKLDTRGVKP